jgi:hypothetical protein
MVLTLLVLVLVLFHAAVWIAHLVHLRKHRALSKLKRGYTLQSLSLSLSLSQQSEVKSNKRTCKLFI